MDVTFSSKHFYGRKNLRQGFPGVMVKVAITISTKAAYVVGTSSEQEIKVFHVVRWLLSLFS